MQARPRLGVLVCLALFVPAAAARAGDGGRLEGVVTLTRGGHPRPQGNGGAVVYLVGFSQSAPDKVAVMMQKHKAFEPAVLPITRGQTVAFPNLDKERHNVFSVSQARRFDLGLAHPGARPTIHFDRTGLVNVYCNIHPQMAGTILVLPNRAFAVTDHTGHFAIDDVPAGTWTLYVWQPLADPIRQKVTVKAGGTVKLTLYLALTKQVKPHMDKYGEPYRKHPHY